MIRWSRALIVALAVLAGTPVADAQPLPSGAQYFGEPVPLPRQPGTTVQAVAVGDVNGDGIADIITAEAPDRIVVHLGNGAGGFTQQVSNVVFSPYGNVVRIELIDADGDGDKDLLMVDGKTATADGYISVWPNAGGGWYSQPAGIYVNNVSFDRTYAVIDLDHDGKQELAILGTNGRGRLFRYDQLAHAVNEDASFANYFFYPDGTTTPFVDSNGQPRKVAIHGEHLLGANWCAGTLVGFRPLYSEVYSLCGAPNGYTANGTIAWPGSVVGVDLGAAQATGPGFAATVSGFASSALLPFSSVGWQLLTYGPFSTPWGVPAPVLRMLRPADLLMAANSVAGTVDTNGDGLTEFVIAGPDTVRYVDVLDPVFAISVAGTGTLNTGGVTPTRVFGARIGRTVNRDDLVMQLNGYVVIHYDMEGAAVSATAPNVTTMGGYSATGQPIGLPVTVTASASGGVAPYTYRFYAGTTLLTAGGSQATLNMPAGGTYTVMAIDAEGMWSTAQGTVTVGIPPPVQPLTVTLPGNTGTAGALGYAVVDLTASPLNPQGAVTYSWSVDGGVAISTGNNPTFSSSYFIGSHTVHLTAADAWSRTAMATATVEMRLPSTSGAPGETGLPGPTGPAGPQGPVGPQGPLGPIGPAGPAGSAGPQGERGADGAMGPAGATGERGADGATGTAGPAGAAGPAGLTGPIGPQGERGSDGAPGAVGSTGAAGPVGPMGPAGPQGLPGAAGSTNWPAGAILYLRQGAAPPAGFVRLGSFRQELNSGERGRGPNGRDDGRDATIVIVVYMKQ